MRASSVIAIVAVAATMACAEPEPTFGPPGGLRGRTLPGVKDETAPGGSGVFGAPYDATTGVPATTMKKAHAAKNVSVDPGPCLGCHVAKTGSLGAPAFAYGGRVVVGREGTEPAPNVDVIVIQGDAKLGPVKSDADGYFWFRSDVDVIDGRTAVRTARGEEKMDGKLFANYGSCSLKGCHGQQPGQPQVYVPQ